MSIGVGVIGVSGYTGLELVKLLLNHPIFTIKYLATTKGDTTISNLHPSLKSVIEFNVDVVNVDLISKECDLIFLALPHKTAMSVAKEFINRDIKVVDLSADYRLDLDTYESNYCEHEDKNNLENSAYGLIEYFRDSIKGAKVTASPGCYPTATLLALLPFIPYIQEGSEIFIDAKSGVSGAGKKLTNINSFVNINENIFAYSPLKHRHAPEIKEKINKIYNIDFNINFVPHLIPITRGELVTVFATLKDNIDPKEILKSQYENEKFIRLRDVPVNVKDVSGTHFCDIFAQVNGRALFINSAIDNLLRGASSQALASANIMCDLDESLGLPTVAYVP